MSRFRRHLSLRRALVLGGLAVCLTVGAVVASATPPAGVAGGPILSRGTVTEDMVIGTPTSRTVTRKFSFRVRGKKVTKRVKVKVNSVNTLIACSAAKPCDTAFQQVTINPGGHTGWHNHPGPTYVRSPRAAGPCTTGGPREPRAPATRMARGAASSSPPRTSTPCGTRPPCPWSSTRSTCCRPARRTRRSGPISRSRRTVPPSPSEKSGVFGPRRALKRAAAGPKPACAAAAAFAFA